MQPRTLYALIAAGLLLFTGSVFAQSETPTEPTAQQPTPMATEPTYGGVLLTLTPSLLTLEPGGMARLEVRIDSDADRTFRVQVRPEDGLRASLSSSDARAGPDHPATLILKVAAPYEHGREDRELTATVFIDDGQGNARSQDATIQLRGRAEPTTPTAQQAHPEPIYGRPVEPILVIDPVYPEPVRPMPARPVCPRLPEPIGGATVEPAGAIVVVDDFDMTPTERRFAMILERIEKRLAALERTAASPPVRPCPMPEPVREPASLTVGEATLDVPADGARVAILLDGGSHGGRFRLAVHSRDDGWSYHLEKDGVAVGPHQRTFVWLRIAPGETATSAYEVVASQGPSSLVAMGTASWSGPQIV